MNFLFIFLLQINVQFLEGDLLFQDCDCGPVCDAIEAVTTSIDHRNFSHIGLVVCDGDSLAVLEANENAVRIVPLKTFINKYKDSLGNPTIAIGRLPDSQQWMVSKAVKFAKSKLGMPYDDDFVLNNGKYYCSELIYEAFKYAQGDKDFFHIYPMTFKNRGSDSFNPTFVQYYQSIHQPIPEGKLGLNPGSISMEGLLKMYYLY